GSGRAATAAALGECRGRSAIASDARDGSDVQRAAQGIACDSAAAPPRQRFVAPSSEMSYERRLAVAGSTCSPTKPEVDAAVQRWPPPRSTKRPMQNPRETDPRPWWLKEEEDEY